MANAEEDVKPARALLAKMAKTQWPAFNAAAELEINRSVKLIQQVQDYTLSVYDYPGI